MNFWRIISSKEIFSHPRIGLIEDEVEFPDGTTGKYLKFKNNGDAVTVICCDHRGRLLLQREYSHPIAEVLWQFPGGHVEHGEDIEAAANRELQEESHLKASKIVYLGKYLTNNRRSDAFMHVVLAEDVVESALIGDPEERIESEWIDFDQVEQMIAGGEIVNVNVLAALELHRAKKC